MTDRTHSILINAALLLGVPLWLYAEFVAGYGTLGLLAWPAVSLPAMVGVWWLGNALRRRAEHRTIDGIIAREGWN